MKRLQIKLILGGKYFKKFKKSKLHVDEDIFKESQKDLRNIIKKKKRKIFLKIKLRKV